MATVSSNLIGETAAGRPNRSAAKSTTTTTWMVIDAHNAVARGRAGLENDENMRQTNAHGLPSSGRILPGADSPLQETRYTYVGFHVFLSISQMP
jgi:hypothetical protein